MFRNIGLRTIKTALSIGLGMLFYILLRLIDNGLNLYNKPTGFRFSDLFSPFFAGIAAAYSLYPSKKQSIAQAKNRVIASLLGGVVGMVLTISYGLIGRLSGNDFFTWPNLGEGFRVEQYILPYILITIGVLVVVILGNLFNKKSAIFVGILTLISVTINPMGMIVNRYNESIPFLGEAIFGTNRILSTVVGVLLSLAVNLFALPRRHKNKDMVFYIGIEGLLKEDSDSLNGYFKYKLIEAKDKKIPCSIFTTRAPMAFMHILKDVEVSVPVCCMSGAAMFDPKIDKYIYKEVMDINIVTKYDAFFKRNDIHPFRNYVDEDSHYVVVDELNTYSKLYFDSKKNVPYSNVIKTKDYNDDLVYYLIIDSLENINKIVEKLKEDNIYDLCHIMITKCYEKFGLKDNLHYLKIYDAKVKELKGLKTYIKEHNNRLISLTAREETNHLLDASDIRITFKNNLEAKDVDMWLETNTYEELFKQVKRIYYSKKYEKKEV